MPVRAFAAARPQGISFCFLHRTCKSRVGQQYYCKAEGKVIPHSELVKAFEYGPDQYVLMEKEDFEAVEPETADAMQITEFVDVSEIDPVYLESSYYLMPQESGAHPYALLAKALDRSHCAAVAKLAMHNREYAVIIRPSGGGLMLHTLYYPDEVRSMEGFGENPDVSAKEVSLVRQLVDAMEAEWKPNQFTDGFKNNLQKAIQEKIAGQSVKPGKKRAKKPAAAVVDISAAIRESLAAAKAKSPHSSEPQSNKKANQSA